MKHSLIRIILGAAAALLLSAGLTQAAERLDGFAADPSSSRSFVVANEGEGNSLPPPWPTQPCGNSEGT